MAGGLVKLPGRMDIGSILGVARTLEYYATRDRIRLQFEDPSFFSPFSMLFIAAKLRSLRSRNKRLTIELKNHECLPYPAHMGFFKMFGCDYGREVGEAWGSENYLPITCLSKSSLYQNASDQWVEMGDLIQREADRIARVITRDRSENEEMFNALSYSIRELLRNVFEHSGSNEVYYCAQYWPRSEKVEFSIADFGIGIRRGLGTNPNFRFPTDKQAIEYSLLPSVSGKTHLPRTSETWFNSGYGLYMTNRLARNGGNFVLASGNTAIHLSRKTKTNYQTAFPGTALRFNLDVSNIGAVQDHLKQFRVEGHQIAGRIAGTGNRPPSAMSLLLRRDFR